MVKRRRRPTRRRIPRRVGLPLIAGLTVLLVGLVVVAALAISRGGQKATAAGSAASSGPAGRTSPSVLSRGLTSPGPSSSRSPSRKTVIALYDPALHNCGGDPHTCGYPDATNTGPPKGMALRSVPGQVSRGPGWFYDPSGWVEVDGNGAVLQGLSIPYNVDVSASNVTIKDVQISAGGGDFGVSLRHTSGVTIEDSTISGQNSTDGRVDSAIDDVYGDSTGMVVKNDNISEFRTAIQISTGVVTGNYIHDPGYISGDHTNGIYVGGTTQPLTISHNTIFNNLGQTDTINLDATSSGQTVSNITVENNLLAGGGYSIYAGAALNASTSNIVIKDNRFSAIYYAQSGQFGYLDEFDAGAPGNVWSGNIWDATGASVSS
jgi:Right handed beta helix region